MKRRLLISNVVLVTVVLLVLEIPLALIYARHEQDALDTALQRDASSLAALSEEIVERPGEHDVTALAQQFSGGTQSDVLLVDRSGTALLSSPLSQDAAVVAALDAARSGSITTGETEGRSFVAVPVGAVGVHHGAVLVARPDDAVDRRIRQFWIVLAAVAVAVLAFSALVSRQLARWAVDPLDRLDERARELGRGNLRARADMTKAPPEVLSLAKTFDEMAARLDDLVTSQRRFVADASHQLRTPLTALRLRLENLDPEHPHDALATRDAALLETARLTRLVDGLLALARAEREPLAQEIVDVNAVVEERREAWAPFATEHAIDLRLDANGSRIAQSTLVPGHLEQILDNLIDNAIEATPAQGAVELRVEATADAIHVHVIDQGPGMSDEHRRQAFAPFWQGRPDANGSAGLGLAIVDQLVRASRGTVVLESTATGGIDAHVRLPPTRP